MLNPVCTDLAPVQRRTSRHGGPRQFSLGCAALLALGLGAQAFAQTQNAPSGRALTCGNIYTTTSTELGVFSTTTGAIKALNAPLKVSGFALGLDPVTRRLYSVGGQSARSSLSFYDGVTGVDTVTGATFPNTSLILRTAFDKAGLGYALANDNTLYTFTTATPPVIRSRGRVTGLSGYYGGDIAFDNEGTIWMVTARDSNTQQVLLRISGGVAREVGNITAGGTALLGSPNMSNLAFGADGKLYGSYTNGLTAYTVDPATARATALGRTGISSTDFASCVFPRVVSP